MADIGTTVRTYLAAQSGVSALVGTRIYPDVLPQGYRTSQGGALVYSAIPVNHDHLLNGLAGIARCRIETTAYSATRAGANAIAEAVRTSGLPGYTGAMGTMQILSVMVEDGIPIAEIPTDGGQEYRYSASKDYTIAYTESV